MTGCTVSGNTAIDGAGLLVYQGGDITLTNCTVSGNSASRATAAAEPTTGAR